MQVNKCVFIIWYILIVFYKIFRYVFFFGGFLCFSLHLILFCLIYYQIFQAIWLYILLGLCWVKLHWIFILFFYLLVFWIVSFLIIRYSYFKTGITFISPLITDFASLSTLSFILLIIPCIWLLKKHFFNYIQLYYFHS